MQHLFWLGSHLQHHKPSDDYFCLRLPYLVLHYFFEWRAFVPATMFPKKTQGWEGLAVIHVNDILLSLFLWLLSLSFSQSFPLPAYSDRNNMTHKRTVMGFFFPETETALSNTGRRRGGKWTIFRGPHPQIKVNELKRNGLKDEAGI